MGKEITGQIFHFAPIKILVALFFVIFSSCATPPAGHEKLRDVLADTQAVKVSAIFEEDGMVVLPDVFVNGTRLSFILDTGATRSALFESQYKRLFASEVVPDQINVHGISTIGARPFVRVATLGLGSLTFNDLSLVILADRKKSSHYDGLIGMDILEKYTLYFSRRNASLKLIPKDIKIVPPYSWQTTSLHSNPFKEDGRNLHFFDVDLSGKKVPALLDTGTEYNLMNWGLKDNPDLRKVYNKLRDDWEYQGAIGDFRPSIKVRVGWLKSNDVIWQNMEFLVLNLDGLKILGMEDELLIIASLKFLENDEFLIDFERKILSVKPDYRRRRLIEPRIYYNGVDF